MSSKPLCGGSTPKQHSDVPADVSLLNSEQEPRINRRRFCNRLLVGSTGLALAAQTIRANPAALQDDAKDWMVAYPPMAQGGYYNVMLSTPAWYSLSVSAWLPAGTYWMAVYRPETNVAAACQIYYDGTGTDRSWNRGGGWWSDSAGSFASDSRSYSFRLSIMT